MSNFADGFETFIVKVVVGQILPSQYGSDRLLHLYTTTPGDSGGGSELSGGGYTAKSILGKFPTTFSTPGEVANNAVIDFHTPSANGGTLSGWAIKDENGLFLMRGELLAQFPVISGSPITFPSGSILVQAQ